MEPWQITEALELLDEPIKERDKNDPWLVYVADKSTNSCQRCAANHGKRFRESDLSRPALPIHPNCKCIYEKLTDDVAKKVAMRSATVRVDGTPGIGGIRISGVDDMLDKLEKTYSPGTLHELIITNHGEFPGEFELGSRRERLDTMTPAQMKRLKKLLSPNAIIDIRMCYGIGNENGKRVAQDLANKLGCRIRAYANQVSPFGTRSPYSYDASPGIPFHKRFFVDPAGETFDPEK